MIAGRPKFAVVLALLATLAPPGAAAAQEKPAGSGEEHAAEVLAEAKQLLGEPAAEPSRDLTPVLAELSQVAPRLDGAEKREARRILARPDDGPLDRYGDGYTAPEADASPACDARFCVHWVAEEPDAPNLADSDLDDVPDFVEEVLASAADSHAVENSTLGWTEPVGDGVRGGGGPDRTDIYLIETNGFYFGYASPDEGQGPITSKEAYLVLDEDYAEFTGPGLTAIEAMQVTMAHEYNHVLQFAYDARQDLWMLEATATWMEDQVYPGIDDYLNYVPAFADTPTVPLTQNAAGLKIYGAAMWNHFLSGTMGADVVRDAWVDSDGVSPPHLSVAAYDSAIGGTGASPFDALGDRFAEFAPLTAEWRALPGVFSDAAALPNVRRSRTLRLRDEPRKLRLGHLAYALLKVRRDAASRDLRLRVRGPAGTHYGIALVGREGSQPAGTVTNETVVVDAGGSGVAKLDGGDYDRVTAVIANADARVGPGGAYRRDDQRFKVKLVRG